MSGHGRFSVIGGGNRPLPIELPKVEDLKPGGDTLGALNVDGVSKDGPAVADTRLDQANRVSAKLDTMLLKAAKTVVKPVDAKALKATTAVLPRATRKAIDKAAAKAETAFQTISKFSGRQIAAAMAKNGDGCFEWDGRNPAGKAIKAALDALAALSEKLVKAINELPKDAPAAVQAALDEAVLRNDRRASEIQTLFCDFADMAEKAFDDPANVERLGKTLASFLPAQSMKMHDSAKIAADFRVSLAPLARRIDELATGKERQLSGGEAASIRRQIDEAANALAKAERDHAAKGMPLDADLFGAAKDVLAKFKARLADIKRNVAVEALRNYTIKTFLQPPLAILHPKFAPLFKMLFPALGAVVETQRRLVDAALAFVDNPTAENKAKMDSLAAAIAGGGDPARDELKKLVGGASKGGYDLGELTSEQLYLLSRELSEEDQDRCTVPLCDAFRAALRSYMAALKQTGRAVKIAYGGLKGVATQTVHLAAMRKTVDDRADAQFLTGKTLDAAFEGRLAVTTLVETRLNGLPDDDADPALDDSNADSSKALGSGAVNTVYEVRFKDGSTYIFKPEAPGRQALASLQLSKGAYQDNQLVAQLNMATQRTADAFGLGDVMTKTSVGAHGGQFGLFMEKAPGVEAELFGKRIQPAPGRLTAGQIRDLDDAQYAKVVGGLMRKANRLEWFDLITGQGDRHGKNYLVEVGKDGSVSLKGIDNDACRYRSQHQAERGRHNPRGLLEDQVAGAFPLPGEGDGLSFPAPARPYRQRALRQARRDGERQGPGGLHRRPAGAALGGSGASRDPAPGRRDQAREGAQRQGVRRFHLRLGEARRPAQGRGPAAAAGSALRWNQEGLRRIRQRDAEIHQAHRLPLPPRPPRRHRQARLVRGVVCAADAQGLPEANERDPSCVVRVV